MLLLICNRVQYMSPNAFGVRHSTMKLLEIHFSYETDGAAFTHYRAHGELQWYVTFLFSILYCVAFMINQDSIDIGMITR